MTPTPADPAAREPDIDLEELARHMADSVNPSQAALDAIEVIDGKRVRIHITNQAFDLDFEGDEPDEAPWMKRMLAHALDTFVAEARAAAYERAARAIQNVPVYDAPATVLCAHLVRAALGDAASAVRALAAEERQRG